MDSLNFFRVIKSIEVEKPSLLNQLLIGFKK